MISADRLLDGLPLSPHRRLALVRGRPDLRQCPAAAGADRGRSPTGRRVDARRRASRRWIGTARNAGWTVQQVRLVGNPWLRQQGRRRATLIDGDEQPLDAAALVEALADALAATDQRRYGERAVRAFEWFLGRNRLGEPVYDFATGGCHDGLARRAMNENEGAESTLAFFQALLALEAAGLQSSLPQP